MSKRDRKDGKGGDYPVGYGKPPVKHQFKKGQSGCPTGRRGNKAPEAPQSTSAVTPTQERILQGFYREIAVTDQGKSKKISLLDLGVRGLAAKAAKGDLGAIKLMLNYAVDIEARQEAAEREGFAQLLQMKRDWREACAHYARLGLERPVRHPDPDDLFLDPVTRTGRVVGPTTAAEALAWDRREARREGIRRGVAAVELAMRELVDPLDAKIYAYELEGWNFWLTLFDWLEPDKAVRRAPGFDYDAWVAQSKRRLAGLNIVKVLDLPIPENTAQIFFEAFYAGEDIDPEFGEAFTSGLHDIYRRCIDPSRIAAPVG